MALIIYEHHGRVCTQKNYSFTKESSLAEQNHQTLQAMRRRNNLFKKTGYSAKFRSARNKVTSLLRRAKANYFKNLNPRDPKMFWKAVRYLNKQHSTIPTLQYGEQTANNDRQKAEMLNAYFSTCFNRSHPPLSSVQVDSSSPSNDSNLDDIYCTVS